MRNSSQAATRSGFARTALRRGFIVAALSSASMLYSTLASALGMGDITLHSALNQPLNAEIELVETAGLSADDIVARLASPEEFARAGVDRVFFFNDFRFTPVIRGNRGVIRVVSSKPVTEPYLQFLVQVIRPGGDMLHEYTLLLDPATSEQGRAAVAGRPRASATPGAEQSRMPVAPPVALEGKRYSVVGGDTLNSIARRMQGSGGSASAGRLADGIKALNPQAFPNGDSTALKVGQSLLLPDAAVLPNSNPAPASTAAAPQPTAQAQRGAEQLAVSAIENQLLTKTVDDLRVQLEGMQASIDGKDKQIVSLQTELAESRGATAQPAPAVPAPVDTPAAAPTASPQSQEGSLLTSPLLVGALAILLLLLVLAWSVQRNRRKQSMPKPAVVDPTLSNPAREPVVPTYDTPAAAARVPTPVVTAPAPSRPAPARAAAGSTDALDGVSIYIAYGRFAEAMGILRDALVKQPERTDIRVRILELLAEQGDSAGFAQEELLALENGVDAEQVQQIRSRYPQLKPAEEASSVTPVVRAAAPVAAAVVAAEVAKEVANEEPAQLDENAASAVHPEPGFDDFQLNLDDLSMDADWDLVDPFDKPVAVRAEAPTEEVTVHEPEFSSNLTELPGVEEIPDDRFLSDFPEEEGIIESNSDALDDSFLDGFMDESGEFDLLDLEEVPLSKVNQAQVLIDEGDIEGARELLQQVIDESDDEHQQTARDLLAGL
ncbi:peptigoglycan-binding protein LysM [Pseudomonas sp. CDFA 553]|uniref:FimV/HubP family polar landmark protein n=1 Tax=Pseudomonas quasicaspiana TaxID=2829821 RepID=UPI001E5888BE|nr:FimV/HubP family polar landmark protein [Pseudomonas quasicaspiana]MCD5988357.1 peptigoglycan-binding protein LysM [Pseudomonas quasicaspiana]